MGTPTSTNTTASDVNAGINLAVQVGEKVAETAAEAALDSAVPIFAAPVIHQLSDEIIEKIISLLGNDISIGLQQVGTFVVIDTQINSENNGISKALANLMAAEKSGNPAAIQAAIKAYADAFSAGVHDDGSATAHT